MDGHLSRLRSSAVYFGMPLDEVRLRRALSDLAAGAHSPRRVRILLHSGGNFVLEDTPLPPLDPGPVRVGLASDPVDPKSVWLHHKTTRRDTHLAARASRPDCDDVLLWSTRGEVTESSIANVVVEIDGHRWTPPLSSGLLAGVERAALLEGGEVREGVVPVSALHPGQRLWLANSVRGEYLAEFVG